MRVLHLEIKDCLDCPYFEKIRGVGKKWYFCNNGKGRASEESFRDLFDECPLPKVMGDE